MGNSMGKKEGEKKGEKNGDGGKDGPITVVFEVDMHCDGCADRKFKRKVEQFDGVDDVKVGGTNNKLTVVGKVDPEKLRKRIETEMKKEVVLVSPLPKKDKEGGRGGGGGGGQKKAREKKKADDETLKEPAVSTVVLELCCKRGGCFRKIDIEEIKKIEGVERVERVEHRKDLVRVKGTMDAESLPAIIQKKLELSVEIVPPKKDDGEGEGGCGGGGGSKKKDKPRGNADARCRKDEPSKKDDEKGGVGGEGGSGGEKEKDEPPKANVNINLLNFGGGPPEAKAKIKFSFGPIKISVGFLILICFKAAFECLFKGK